MHPQKAISKINPLALPLPLLSKPPTNTQRNTKRDSMHPFLMLEGQKDPHDTLSPEWALGTLVFTRLPFGLASVC